jgi:hypothetical protein
MTPAPMKRPVRENFSCDVDAGFGIRISVASPGVRIAGATLNGEQLSVDENHGISLTTTEGPQSVSLTLTGADPGAFVLVTGYYDRDASVAFSSGCDFPGGAITFTLSGPRRCRFGHTIDPGESTCPLGHSAG